MESGSMKIGSAVEDALDSEVAPGSELLVVLDSVSSEVVVPPDSEMASLLPATSEPASLLLDSSTSSEKHSVLPDFVPDSMLPDFVPDSVEVVQCPRCGTFHAGGVFGEACYQARREAHRCARCGLIHSDYDLTSWILHDIEKFECELYIPDVQKLEMRGNTIILPEHVLEKLDEMLAKKEQ